MLRTEKEDGWVKDLREAVTDVRGWGKKDGGLGKGLAVRPERDGWTGALC